ncbi:hypothetical protein A2617_02260 [Candidatus Daviesbacteria bacterium RIFOXYD1_FULL_41_10]|uniref:Uncharacterized protein n=1 Tax=Candidatus Daviesbacteria bacterium RIFOXYD1_FULL_41_10 TaxID=1797801 RepID=A0A1F5MZQ5_9BACT|nr:MAG: hypothetical protein A2617_02260 [Candidatus Daviesbacteria bacterium RIFOXYD1_FULL_41_10]
MAKSSPLLIDIGSGLSIMASLPTLNSWETADRPKRAKAGTFGFNFQTNNLEYWDGNSWFAASMKEK